MAYKIKFAMPCSENDNARIGGKAFIGGISDWPETPEGLPLTLVMSIPTNFLNRYADFHLPEDFFVSVFTYYSKDEYFLDLITYHGNQSELDIIRKGYTKVLLHIKGKALSGPITIPAMNIEVDERNFDPPRFQESKIGGDPDQLQSGKISLGEQRFALQLYGDVFPDKYTDIFFLADGLAYLFIQPHQASVSQAVEAGTFFVQVT
jgi:hypothetical protein